MRVLGEMFQRMAELILQFNKKRRKLEIPAQQLSGRSPRPLSSASDFKPSKPIKPSSTSFILNEF